MNVLIDGNIPYGKDAFRQFGDVRTIDARRIVPSDMTDVDLLIVRSTVKIDSRLLTASRVKFIGSPVSGTDHIDFDYLRSRKIAVSWAPGCNANSVAEYCVAAFMALSRRFGMKLSEMSVGVIGVGHVGTRVVEKARALGMAVMENDPPLFRKTGDPRYRPLEDALRCDFVTIHVPLTFSGKDSTYHMVDRAFLGKMRPGSILLNTSRGAVVREDVLKKALATGRLGAAVLDVWEGEPEIDTALLEKVEISTPHIAGYSLEGKLNGLIAVYRAACAYFGHEERWLRETPPPAERVREVDISLQPPEACAIEQAVKTSCNIEKDDERLKKMIRLPPGERAPYFDRLRREYPLRREFAHYRIILSRYSNGSIKKVGEVRAVLASLGFQLDPVS
jgi:erythronate-4-phosphate dehydrogenase